MARALCGGSLSSSPRAAWPAACSDTTSFRRASCRDRCALVHIFPSLRSQADHPLTRNQMGFRRRGALKQALSATMDQASGSTLRRCLARWAETGLLAKVHALLAAML